jgi:glycosyltransferase involved in cell wall biosynthesis
MSGLRILTNFERFPATWSVPGGQAGTSALAKTIDSFRARTAETDLFLINGDVELVYRLAGARLRNRAGRIPLVAVDLVLRRPSTLKARASAFGKKMLLKRVDHFINYFRASEGYARFFGITPERSSWTHFKPNLRYRYEPSGNNEGRYVLCFGRSQRDYDTFFRAMATLPYPGAIPNPDFAGLKANNSRFTYPLDQLPKNVELLEDDGSQAKLIEILEGARLVVLPILATSLLAGVSVYLNAMLLNKCVIISKGPGVSDVLTPEQAILVPPERPEAVARAIQMAWEDEGLRNSTAAAGHAHALSLGGEPELFQRILDLTMAWYSRRAGQTRP